MNTSTIQKRGYHARRLSETTTLGGVEGCNLAFEEVKLLARQSTRKWSCNSMHTFCSWSFCKGCLQNSLTLYNIFAIKGATPCNMFTRRNTTFILEVIFLFDLSVLFHKLAFAFGNTEDAYLSKCEYELVNPCNLRYLNLYEHAFWDNKIHNGFSFSERKHSRTKFLEIYNCNIPTTHSLGNVLLFFIKKWYRYILTNGW